MSFESKKELSVLDLRRFPNYYFGKAKPNEVQITRNPGKLEGVFALALKNRGELVLARDKFGEMPLYFLVSSKTVAVANTISDLKQQKYFNYELVRCVPPVYLTKISLCTGKVSHKQYYKQKNLKASRSLTEISKRIRSCLEEAVSMRLPDRGQKIAVLLSGGADSFTISYLLKRMGVRFTAYTMTVDGKGKDLPNAIRAASFLDIPLRQVDISRSEIGASVEKVVGISELYQDYDVFMAVGTYFLARALQKDGVDVTFTGDGANELFGDYHPWGSFQMKDGDIISKRMRRLMVFGRNFNSKYYNRQLGSGLGRSLCRLDKILFHYGVKVCNPFLDTKLVEYLLALDKAVLAKHSKQEMFSAAFPDVPPDYFPQKIRLQDGVGITDILVKEMITKDKLKRIHSRLLR